MTGSEETSRGSLVMDFLMDPNTDCFEYMSKLSGIKQNLRGKGRSNQKVLI